MLSPMSPHVMMEFRIVGKELLLDYELLTEKCFWSIFDIGGVEMCKGDLDGQAPHKIPLDSLSPNVYQLCVIDGDKLLNSRFRVS
jgi:hypothetical protein